MKSRKKPRFESEAAKAKKAAYRIANRERAKIQMADWYKANRDRLRARAADYRNSPSGKHQRHRAECKRRGILFDLTVEFFANIPDNCPQCDKLFGCGRMNSASVDRIVPSGGYVMSNVEWLCGECNRKKDTLTYSEMIEFGQKGLQRTAI